MRVLVVGAGVTGLTVGVRLAQEGHDVHLFARELPLETTSAVAAALWYPYRAYPFELVLQWSAHSLDVFTELASSQPAAGVALRQGVELLRTPTPDPWWASAVPSLARLTDVPHPYRDGWSFVAPVIEMPVYLRWLQATLESLGGTVTRMALAELPNQAELVVNCSGLGARQLAHDPSVTPIRGQIIRLGQVGVDRWLLDGEGPTYVVPRSEDITVGGTDTEGEWSRSPDPLVADEILSRAINLVPELADAPILGHSVGLRPARNEIRLEEVSTSGGGRLIHCYGQGGAGVTVSWGCAGAVLDLVAEASSEAVP